MKQLEVTPQVTECRALSPVDVFVWTVAALLVTELLDLTPEGAEILSVIQPVLINTDHRLLSERGGGGDGLRWI